MMDQSPRSSDFNKFSTHRRHRSSASASFRHPFHGFNGPTPAHDPLRQASLHLDFLIIGGGLSHVSRIILLKADMLFHQESPGWRRRTRSLHRATVFECLSKRGACSTDQGVYGYLPMQPASYHTGESRRSLYKRPLCPRRVLSLTVSIPASTILACIDRVHIVDIADESGISCAWK
jgi:hypothetical protein